MLLNPALKILYNKAGKSPYHYEDGRKADYRLFSYMLLHRENLYLFPNLFWLSLLHQGGQNIWFWEERLTLLFPAMDYL